MTKTYCRSFGFSAIYLPQYSPTADAFFKSNKLAGICGISPPANPTTNKRPSQAILIHMKTKLLLEQDHFVLITVSLN